MWLSVRYRPLQAVALVALAALIATCVVLAPLYYRAMQQALTRLTVDAASSSATAIQLTALSRFQSFVELPGYVPATHDELAELLPASARAWFLPRVDATSLTVFRIDRAAASPVGELLWRDGACDHVTWTAGGCPQDAGDIAVSTADAQNFDLRVGTTLTVEERPGREVDEPVRTRLRVTGIYRQTPGAYWNDRLLEGLSGFPEARAGNRPQHDTWLTTSATFDRPESSAWTDPVTTVTFDLDRAAVGVDEVVQTGPLVEQMTAAAALRIDDVGNWLSEPGMVVADVQSGLPSISTTIDEGRRQALVTVPLLMVQLALLALFVLVLVLGAAVEQRRPELALARLRGAGRKDARRLVVAELLPVILAGVPLGVAGGLALSAVARAVVLDGDAPFELPSSFWGGIAGAAAVLCALTWLSASRGTRDPIASLLRGVPARVPGWSLGVLDAVLIAAAGTAVVAFLTGSLRGPLALAAPGLLALMVGLLLAHLLVPTATWLGRRLLAAGRYSAALAVLALARRPSTRRLVTVITVASALLVFSTAAIGVGSRERELAAQRDNGAAMVADLNTSDVSRVVQALAPVADGHATTVVRTAPSIAGEGSRTTLAVSPADFGRIALFPDSDPGLAPWSDLRLDTPPRPAVTGRVISFLVTPEGFGIASGVAYAQLDLIDTAGNRASLDLGEIPVGAARTMSVALPCETGCTVTGFGVRSAPGVRYSGRIVLSQFRVPGGSTTLPGAVADWRPGDLAGTAIEATAAGPGSLTVRLVNNGQGPIAMTPLWFPTVLPALVGGPGTDPDATGVSGRGLDGLNRELEVVGRLPWAPAVGGAAALVDLDLLQRWGTRVAGSSRVQVWFDSESESLLARVQEALRADGVEVSSVRRVSDVRNAFEASVPSWSLQLGGLVAVAGLLIAALVIVLLLAGGWRRRSRDLASLELSGVPRRGLGRIAIGEQLPVVVLAVIAGAGCGALGALLALPTLPLFAVPRNPSTLDVSLPWSSMVVVAAGALVVLAVVTSVCGRVVLARASAARVRDSL